MPPRSKRRRSIAPSKPGILVQHILDKYSTLPVVSSEFLKGHVLFIYITVGDRSRAKTRNELLSHIPSSSQAQDALFTEQLVRYLNAGIKRIVSETLEKFTKPSNPKEFQEFCKICEVSFLLDPGKRDDSTRPMETSPDAEKELEMPSTPPPVSVLPNTPVETRQIAKCVNCKRMQNSMKELREKQLKMRKEKSAAIRNILAKQKKKGTIKTLNQTIKRKNAQLKALKAKLLPDDNVVAKLTAMNRYLRRRHSAVKRYHRKKKSKDSSHVDLSSYEYEIIDLQEKCEEKDAEIVVLQTEKCLLEDKLSDYENATKSTKCGGKGHSMDMRMMVYDAISDQVPTANIPHLISQFSKRCGLTLSDIPHRTTIENMTRELGAIADLQTAEVILANENTTLGFDATTQEGRHINSIHVTTKEDCYVVAVDELSGGAAEDYSTHIIDSFDNLATVYEYFTGQENNDTEKKLIKNIANTMTDCCIANHAAVRIVEEKWGKEINELNCHLHPLDSIATKSRDALKKCEEGGLEKGLWEKDCTAGNIVLSFNKLRYKDGKGDPRGFITFLNDKNLPRRLLPRYRGNRPHILFHVCGVLIDHYSHFMEFLQNSTSCGELRNSLLKDFNSVTGHVEMQVLGIMGKFLSDPWMKKFYRSASDQIDYVEGIKIIERVVERLDIATDMIDPLDLLKCGTDFFGEPLDVSSTLTALRQEPKDPGQFRKMMKAVVSAVIDVLQRQYKKYFGIEVTEKLKEEAMSARSHSTDAEEVLGMFSATRKRAPNATLCFISCKLRAQKNHTVAYLDALPAAKRENIVKKATSLAFQQRNRRRLRQKELELELSKRLAARQQGRETTDHSLLEEKIKSIAPEKIAETFVELSGEKLEDVTDLLGGKCVGRSVCHVWYEDGQAVTYNGKIEQFKSKGQKYVVAYWNSNINETYEEDGTDYDMTVYAMAADLISDDLVLN